MMIVHLSDGSSLQTQQLFWFEIERPSKCWYWWFEAREINCRNSTNFNEKGILNVLAALLFSSSISTI